MGVIYVSNYDILNVAVLEIGTARQFVISIIDSIAAFYHK